MASLVRISIVFSILSIQIGCKLEQEPIVIKDTRDKVVGEYFCTYKKTGHHLVFGNDTIIMVIDKPIDSTCTVFVSKISGKKGEKGVTLNNFVTYLPTNNLYLFETFDPYTGLGGQGSWDRYKVLFTDSTLLDTVEFIQYSGANLRLTIREGKKIK